MIIVGEGDLRAIEEAIVNAAISGRDHHGYRVRLGTLDPGQLRAAALAALSVATGTVIWPEEVRIEQRTGQPLAFVDPEPPRR